jgi:glycosyltransferase involved in cell wall biosynthesis
MPPIRILIAAENISMKMGGEASLPLYYARLFQERGAEVWLTCHERVAAELNDALPDLVSRTILVSDTQSQRVMWARRSVLPYRLSDTFVGNAIHFSTQRRMRNVALELVRDGKIDVVFEPSPITPKGLSFMYDLGVPVVIGPLCGGMSFPPAFRQLDSLAVRTTIELSRHASYLAHRVVPGKLNAAVLLVANRTTEAALPIGHRARVIRLFESGVDLDIWRPDPEGSKPVSSSGTEPIRFVFSGRFVDWKGIQYLVPAFAKAVARVPGCVLDLIGGGELEGEVRAQIAAEKVESSVRLHGWLARPDAARIVREADVFMMPSLRECGGTAILEAMAMAKPVITTNWGGPADYVTPSCGILVDPSSPQAFIDGMVEAIVKLAQSPELRRQLGQGGVRRVREDHLDWNSKADRVLEVLHEAIAAKA